MATPTKIVVSICDADPTSPLTVAVTANVYSFLRLVQECFHHDACTPGLTVDIKPFTNIINEVEVAIL